MTLGQSRLQLGNRERDIIRLPSCRRKGDPERFHNLAVTCTWRCRIIPGNTGKVGFKEVSDSLRICHCPPSRHQEQQGRHRKFPSNLADFLE
ncbi:hypothetical protein E2C01_071532 [Portunus trituberculatus]|uniref:Uncharacterized protein n=1 Tax=Portunus trituberculatus TaxID=210409 RepID=A0A5B7I6G5_PORTR|nr:hypothetical protein [Portunus trituberculatus]